VITVDYSSLDLLDSEFIGKLDKFLHGWLKGDPRRSHELVHHVDYHRELEGVLFTWLYFNFQEVETYEFKLFLPTEVLCEFFNNTSLNLDDRFLLDNPRVFNLRTRNSESGNMNGISFYPGRFENPPNSKLESTLFKRAADTYRSLLEVVRSNPPKPEREFKSWNFTDPRDVLSNWDEFVMVLDRMLSEHGAHGVVDSQVEFSSQPTKGFMFSFTDRRTSLKFWSGLEFITDYFDADGGEILLPGYSGETIRTSCGLVITSFVALHSKTPLLPFLNHKEEFKGYLSRSVYARYSRKVRTSQVVI